MALVNHAKREINAKIVYYGPERAGKATSLRYVYDRVKPELRGAMKAVPASGSSLLFFDFSPFDLPVFEGYHLRLHIYTLQGVVANPAAWKMTLKGVDGLVIVGDSSPGALPATQQCLTQLRGFLASYGLGLDDIPLVLQLNKADLAAGAAAETIAGELGLTGCRVCPTTAVSGTGVLDALAALSRLVLGRIGERSDLQRKAVADSGSETVVDAPADVHIFRADTELDGTETCETTPQCAASPAPADVYSSKAAQLQVAVAEEGVLIDGATVRIPLDVTTSGRMQRLMVTVMVAPA